MDLNAAKLFVPERRSEPRCMVNRPYYCKLSIDQFKVSYQFKIWNRTRRSISLLVDKDSEILPRLKRSEVMHLMYHPSEGDFPVIYLKTVVRHITNDHGAAGKGHCLVGLEIVKQCDIGRVTGNGNI